MTRVIRTGEPYNVCLLPVGGGAGQGEGAHIELLSRVRPIEVNGPPTRSDALLIDRLSGGRGGRLSFITRMGAQRIRVPPHQLEAARGRPITWMTARQHDHLVDRI